jgi:hypothetical protein
VKNSKLLIKAIKKNTIKAKRVYAIEQNIDTEIQNDCEQEVLPIKQSKKENFLKQLNINAPIVL